MVFLVEEEGRQRTPTNAKDEERVSEAKKVSMERESVGERKRKREREREREREETKRVLEEPSARRRGCVSLGYL